MKRGQQRTNHIKKRDNFMNSRGDWLRNLLKEDIWANNLEDIPAIIVRSYNQLKEFADDGQVYGIMLLLKDVYSDILTILKTGLFIS